MAENEDTKQIQGSVSEEMMGLLKQHLDQEAEELSIRRQQIEKGHDWLQQYLAAEFADSDKERAHELKVQRNWQGFLLIVLLLVIALVVITAYINKEIAMRIVDLVFALALITVGYYLRDRRSKSSGNNH
jgi:hypothetical protein